MLLHCVYILTEMAQFSDRSGVGEFLGQLLLRIYHWPLRKPASL